MSETRAAAEEKIVWDMPKADSYGGYLDLPTLLSAQKPRSDDHDEMLFIVIHQASELWMKLALHELTAALHFIQRDMLDDSLKILSRIGRVQQQMIQSWDVLATMTPHDYQRLRPYLGSSSGFQSHQYRHMEFLLGNKDRKLAEVHRNDPAAYEVLKQVLEAPGLYDEVLMFLPTVPAKPGRRSRLAHHLPRRRKILGFVRPRRKTRRSRRPLPAVAFSPSTHRPTNHRYENGHRRQLRRPLPHPRPRPTHVPGIMDIENHAVTAGKTSSLSRSRQRARRNADARPGRYHRGAEVCFYLKAENWLAHSVPGT